MTDHLGRGCGDRTLKIDVAILTRNSERYLNECLEALGRNIPVNRLIVVDNNSRDKTLDILHKHSKRLEIIVLQDNGNRATARQKAIENIETEWFMFVDSDIILQEQWFQRAKKFMEPDIGLISGYAEVMNPQARLRFNALLSMYKILGKTLTVKDLIIASSKWRTASNNMLVRLEAVRNIKIPPFLHVFEDLFIKKWVERRNYRAVISPESNSWHCGRLTGTNEELVLYGTLGRELEILSGRQIVKRIILAVPRALWILGNSGNTGSMITSLRNDLYPCIGWLGYRETKYDTKSFLSQSIPASSALPKVSIVVTVKNEEQYVGDLLDSIDNLSYPHDKFDTTVVDGGSTDNTAEIVSKYPQVRLIEAVCSRSKGLNMGIDVSDGEIVAITDGDCIVDRKWLRNIVIGFRADPEIGAVGGPYLPSGQKGFAKYLSVVNRLWFPRRSGYIGNYQRLGGGNVAYKRSLLREVGGFDERIGMGTPIRSGDDVDLNLKIMNRGYKLRFIENIRIFHKVRTSFAETSKEIYHRGVDSSRYYKEIGRTSRASLLRNLGIFSLWMSLAFAFLASLVNNVPLVFSLIASLFFGYYMYKLISIRYFYGIKMGFNVGVLAPALDIYLTIIWSLGAFVGYLSPTK